MPECRIVLVRPHHPGNLGAVARVMHNFGLARLVLVDPLADPRDAEARRLATHGASILDDARIVPDLAAALADCVLTAATSARIAGVVRQTGSGSARELLPILAAAEQRGPTALVFGPEPSGLSTAEIDRCHYLMHIPTSAAHPALNLAQAVAIVAYERSLASGRSVGQPAHAPPASVAEQERMFERLRQALEAIHFLYGPKADSLMHALRHLIGRAQPTAGEVKILHGLARQLEWVLANGPSSAPEAPDDLVP